ncbi:MAG TPA: recombinase family protein [Propionicimonas sp.]
MTDTTKQPLRVARYLRVSTRDQRPDLQADETMQVIERRGWVLVDTFIDHGISGTTQHRPEIDRLLAAARKGAFDVLLVWRADRLFRSLKHMVCTLDEVAALGIDFVSVTEPFDSTTPTGKLMLQLVAAFGEFERCLIAERCRAGQTAARKRGVRIGRPRVVVDVQRALGLRAAGMSLRQVAAELKIGVATLSRAFQNAPAADIRKAGSPEPSQAAVEGEDVHGVATAA